MSRDYQNIELLPEDETNRRCNFMTYIRRIACWFCDMVPIVGRRRQSYEEINLGDYSPRNGQFPRSNEPDLEDGNANIEPDSQQINDVIARDIFRRPPIGDFEPESLAYLELCDYPDEVDEELVYVETESEEEQEEPPRMLDDDGSSSVAGDRWHCWNVLSFLRKF